MKQKESNKGNSPMTHEGHQSLDNQKMEVKMNQRFTPVMQSLQGIRAKWEKEHKELLKKADEILEDIRQLDLVIAKASGKEQKNGV